MINDTGASETEIWYLIARAPQDHPRSYSQNFVTYSPNSPNIEIIGIYTGRIPYDPGGQVSPARILESPYFLNHLEKCGGSWFLPMIQRMARGEIIPLDEIAAAYRLENGTEMEDAPLGSHFPCEMTSLKWLADRHGTVIVDKAPPEEANEKFTQWLKENEAIASTLDSTEIVKNIFREEDGSELHKYIIYRLKHREPSVQISTIEFAKQSYFQTPVVPALTFSASFSQDISPSSEEA